jgi:glycine/D-amino acid oxidase-like deaminating enzyme
MKNNKKKFTVAIIGRGFAGLTSAVELARTGVKDIVLIHDELSDCSASSAAQGLSAIKGILEADANLFALKLEGHRGFESWLKDVEAAADKRRPSHVWQSGVAENFETRESFRKDFGRIYRGDFIGAKNVTVSFARDDSFARAEYPGDFWIESNYLLGILNDAARKMGVTMLAGKVEMISAEQGGALIIAGPHTVAAECTIIAAGPESFSLLPDGADQSFADICGVSGYTFHGDTIGTSRCEVKGTSSFVASHGKAYWGSTSDAAAPIANVLVKLENAGMEGRTTAAKELAKKIISDSSVLTNIRSNWGIRVRAKGRIPIVRKVHDGSNIWLNTGYYKSGIILAWLFAKRLAEQVAISIKNAERPETSNR